MKIHFSCRCFSTLWNFRRQLAERPGRSSWLRPSPSQVKTRGCHENIPIINSNPIRSINSSLTKKVCLFKFSFSQFQARFESFWKLYFFSLTQDFLFDCTKPLSVTPRERIRERKEKCVIVIVGGGMEPTKTTINNNKHAWVFFSINLFHGQKSHMHDLYSTILVYLFDCYLQNARASPACRVWISSTLSWQSWAVRTREISVLCWQFASNKLFFQCLRFNGSPCTSHYNCGLKIM